MENGVSNSVTVVAPYSFYLHASKIFDYLNGNGKIDPPSLPRELSPIYIRRGVYDLAYSAFKHKAILEDVLDQAEFFFRFLHLRASQSLVDVILYDYQQRRFPTKRPSLSAAGPLPFGVTPEVEEIVETMHVRRVKLSAALARIRVAASALDISGLLDAADRADAKSVSLQPLCARVNTIRTETDDVLQILKEQGWCVSAEEVNGFGKIEVDRRILLDPVVPDLLLFPSSVKRTMLSENPLITDRMLVVEDRVDALIAASLGPLITEGSVIITSGGSEGLISHLAATMKNRKIVYIVGPIPSCKKEQIKDSLTLQGISNVRFISESFTRINPANFRDIKTILVIPPSTNSAVINPVDHLTIHGDVEMDSLSLFSAGECKEITHLSEGQKDLLSHSLFFPQVEIVAYCVRSHNHAEAEGVVQSAMERLHYLSTEENRPFRFYNSHVMRTLRDLESAAQIEKEEASSKIPSITEEFPPEKKCLQVQPSSMSDGFSLAILRRKLLPPREVLRLATMKGIIDLQYLKGEQTPSPLSSTPSQLQRKDSNGSAKKKVKKKGGVKRKPSCSLLKLTQAAKNRMSELSIRQKAAKDANMYQKPFKM